MATKIAKRKPEYEEDDLIGNDNELPASDRKVSRKHNNPPEGEVSSERLRSFIQRIEKLEEDKHAVMEDIKDVYIEVKGSGFDVKVVRAIIRRRRQEAEEIREFEELLDLYLGALGMI